MPEPITPVLVLGLGNDILTDDAVGLHIAQAVRERLTGDPRIEVRSTTEMGLALLDELADRDSVVLVDSVQTGREAPGHIREIDAATIASVSSTVPHMLGVGETLALGKLLGLAMPRQVRVFAVEVADPFRLGMEMTAAVSAVVGQAADQIAVVAREMAGCAV